MKQLILVCMYGYKIFMLIFLVILNEIYQPFGFALVHLFCIFFNNFIDWNKIYDLRNYFIYNKMYKLSIPIEKLNIITITSPKKSLRNCCICVTFSPSTSIKQVNYKKVENVTLWSVWKNWILLNLCTLLHGNLILYRSPGCRAMKSICKILIVVLQFNTPI